jgi:hypothetical protein
MRLFALLLLIISNVLMAADPVDFGVGGFTFNRPLDWKWVVPSSPMRKAQLAIAGPSQNSADVTFFHFGPGQGGGVQANVDRWFGQFQNAKASQNEVTLGGVRVVYVQASGTFSSGMPGGPSTPMENYALRGAILEDGSKGDVFVKMTGPAVLVESSWAAFEEMVNAAVVNKP